MADAYELLGIPRNADVPEIRRAHRELARRWHPDRFQEGPERLWAESKMIEINLAYEDALREADKSGSTDGLTPEAQQLEDVKQLLGLGQISAARQALMRIATRSAEWNYLFGAVLMRLGEIEKAALYFGVASRQRPDNVQYETAFLSAETIRGMQAKKRRLGLFRR